MNFFEAQDQARKATRWLVVVYLVSTALIVAGVTLLVGFALVGFLDPGHSAAAIAEHYSPLLIATAVGTALFIFGASLFKTAVLSAGGGKVATSMGGTLVPADVGDPMRQRLRNVVEEVAIASGVPVPEIYILEHEAGINAFAAGFAPGDAAIAVTRGTLELLDRDELQGVIAHEFSHILNGDMRLNIRLMGILFGIMVLGLIGRMIVRGGYHTSIVSSRRDRGAPVVLIIGLGLAILGGIGVFFSRIIKASVSRQRELLADASAVQFTRQTRGLADALKKIGGYKPASYIKSADPEEVSHMLFAPGARFAGLFATHPPLTARIQALEPSFRESDYPTIDQQTIAHAGRGPGAAAAAFAPSVATSAPAEIVDTVGRPENRHYHYAQALRQTLPLSLYDAAHSSQLAYLLAIALVIDPEQAAYSRQLALVQERMGSDRARLVRQYAEEVSSANDAYRLPLLEVAFPALKRRPSAELEFLIDTTKQLIEIDEKINLFEYCFHRILLSSLGQAIDPAGARRARRASGSELRKASTDLLTVVAANGSGDAGKQSAALSAGLAVIGVNPSTVPQQGHPDGAPFNPAESVAVLDHSLDTLLALGGRDRRRLLLAVTEVADHDGRLDTAEAELIRVVCAALECPLPPILDEANPISNDRQ